MDVRRSRITRAGLAVSLGGVLALGAACSDDGVDSGIGESDFTELESEVSGWNDRVTEMEERIGVLEDQLGVDGP